MPEYKIIIESTDKPLEGSLKPEDIAQNTKDELKKETRTNQRVQVRSL